MCYVHTIHALEKKENKKPHTVIHRFYETETKPFMASSHGIKVVHVFHTKVNEFDKKGTDVKRFTSGHLLMKEGIYSSWNRKRLTDKEKGGQKERA